MRFFRLEGFRLWVSVWGSVRLTPGCVSLARDSGSFLRIAMQMNVQFGLLGVDATNLAWQYRNPPASPRDPSGHHEDVQSSTWTKVDS